MKRLVCLAFLLLTACATRPPADVIPIEPLPAPGSPGPAQPSHIGILDDSTGYVGDCFAGFFRPQTQHKPDGSMAWVMIDPFDGTGELQVDDRHLILQRISSSGDPAKGPVHDRYSSAEAGVTADLHYSLISTDQDGLHLLEGTLTVTAADWHETLNLSGQSSCS